MPQRWNKAADLRREQIESGLDLTFSHVFVPYFRKCIEEYQPHSVLDVGCGTGHLPKTLANVCAHIEALEPSTRMHAVAAEVLIQSKVKLHASPIEEFQPNRRFDFVVSHLCGHVVADIDKFCAACSAVLASRGVFLFSLPHPCFWNAYKEFFPKAKYRYAEEQFTSATFTITKDPKHPIEGVPFHHRPLGRYVTALRNCQMALTRLEEIVPPKSIQQLYEEEWQFPRYCVLHAVKIV